MESLELSPGDLDQIRQFVEANKYNQMDTYLPYGHPETLCPDGALWKFNREYLGWSEWSNKPWQMEFLNAGLLNPERMSMCANRTGKTNTAGFETACHMTGIYPEWWEGQRFPHPVLVWTGSPTNETSRDIVQKSLLGGTTQDLLGTGWIPRHLIDGKPKMRQAGVSDVVDTFRVKHSSGGTSQCVLKTYEQGWRKWQGTEPHIVWLDEEPDESQEQVRIYEEALTRILTSRGRLMVTFTPLLGQTRLVTHYMNGGKGVYLVGATWEDSPHLNREERERLACSYSDHQLDARTKGVPMLGEGAIFTVPEEEIVIPKFDIPYHYALIKGIDFGIDHPAAVAELAWNRDRDIIYLTNCWKKQGIDSSTHVEMINKNNPWVPVAWPHDGTNKEKSSGVRLKDHYKKARMLSLSARYRNDKAGSQPVEPIIMEMQDRISDGRFKVFSHCYGFLQEYRNYHRKNGLPVKTNDDILKAVFYAVMMRRYAATSMTDQAPYQPPRPLRV